jgi:hypothetical protein
MIKFDRRSFFAALAAPFVARFLPKPKATGGLFNPHTEIPVQYYCRALIRETEIAVSEEMLHYLGFKCAVGTGYYFNGVLCFNEEYPNGSAFTEAHPYFQGAETPVRHEAT